MHYKIIELTPVLCQHTGQTVDAVSTVAMDFESFEAASLALLAYEAESAQNLDNPNDWSVYAVLTMTAPYPLLKHK